MYLRNKCYKSYNTNIVEDNFSELKNIPMYIY